MRIPLRNRMALALIWGARRIANPYYAKIIAATVGTHSWAAECGADEDDDGAYDS
jgi:hypothetical protein